MFQLLLLIFKQIHISYTKCCHKKGKETMLWTLGVCVCIYIYIYIHTHTHTHTHTPNVHNMVSLKLEKVLKNYYLSHLLYLIIAIFMCLQFSIMTVHYYLVIFLMCVCVCVFMYIYIYAHAHTHIRKMTR